MFFISGVVKGWLWGQRLQSHPFTTPITKASTEGANNMIKHRVALATPRRRYQPPALERHHRDRIATTTFSLPDQTPRPVPALYARVRSRSANGTTRYSRLAIGQKRWAR